MIDKEKLDRLSTLISLQVENAKMGGTPLFERVQKIISREYNELVEELEKEYDNAS